MQYHLNGFTPGDPDIQPAAPTKARQNGPHGLPDKVDVVIVGCGPAGLCLAAQIAQHAEISTLIVDAKAGPMEKGQADGINLRSMEMFQAFGLADKIKRESVWINETTFWQPAPECPSEIIRVGRVQDVADGLSEMPHVLINQARIHDMYLDLMRNSPSRLEPDYGLTVTDVEVSAAPTDHPVTVTLAGAPGGKTAGKTKVQARYVVGCDGARSQVRRSIGGELHGDAAHQAWGVMDILAVTDFPDIRMKSIIQSKDAGNILVLPREGGYLVRLYVEMDKLDRTERVADRKLEVTDIITKAQRIFHPYTLDIKDVVWWSIYEIGHRLTDKFDDVPLQRIAEQTPRVFTAGDACHTHSPKAGQGMNVSMGDTFNLGWKLISVLTGRAKPSLLHTYSTERRDAAQALIDYDHTWARLVSTPPSPGEQIPKVQRQFIEGGRFTAGLTVKYAPSRLVGRSNWQNLATGFDIGMRFHSAPVIRLADAKPMELGHVASAGIGWMLYAFANDADPSDPNCALHRLCQFLEHKPHSPLVRYRRAGEDIDALIDLRAILQQGFREVSWQHLPTLLRPAKGRFGLIDYEKVFCAQPEPERDIFSLRGIDREQGCLVVVRPDQYVAHVLPLHDLDGLAAFFDGVFLPTK